MAETLAKLVGSIERALRYVLSGFVLSALVLFSMRQVPQAVSELQENLLAALFIVAMLGFGAFTVYRLILWTLLDYIAWKCKWSAPSIEKVDGRSYAELYARFLLWRHDPALNQSLSGYLTYRWSAAHFVTLSGIVAVVVAPLAQAGSLVARYYLVVLIAGIASIGIGLWQLVFLFRTEKALRKGTSQGT